MQHNLLGVMDDEKIRLREEVQEQIRALNELKEMAAQYGDDISKPATNSREAVQVRTATRVGFAVGCPPTATEHGLAASACLHIHFCLSLLHPPWGERRLTCCFLCFAACLPPAPSLQWTYYAYLAAVKEQDGAAMSMGRIDAFLDTYFEKDLKAGRITEEGVQELIDQFVMKMRIVRWAACRGQHEWKAAGPAVCV